MFRNTAKAGCFMRLKSGVPNLTKFGEHILMKLIQFNFNILLFQSMRHTIKEYKKGKLTHKILSASLTRLGIQMIMLVV